MSDVLKEIAEFLQKGKAKDCADAVKKALDSGVSPSDVLNKGLIAGMDVVGTNFKDGKVFVPEVLVSARAMNKGVEVLKPYLSKAGVQPIGKAVICTVKGDLHDIGKNLVKLMVEGRGVEVTDLGADVPVEKMIETVKSTGATVLLMSAMLTTTITIMKDAVDALKAAGLKDKVKVMVGGSPINQNFCDSIGGDGYAADAATAADVCRKFF